MYPRSPLQELPTVVVVRAAVPRRVPDEVRRDGGTLDHGGGVGPPRLLHVHAGVDALGDTQKEQPLLRVGRTRNPYPLGLALQNEGHCVQPRRP